MTCEAGLLVMAPLRVESMALGPSILHGGSLDVRRTGAGLPKARAAAGRLARSGPRAVALAGIGGALTPRLAPGDVVVADRVLDDRGRVVKDLPSAPMLAGELCRLGLRSHVGTVVSTDHIVRGDERAALARLGADVVDMESAAVAQGDWAAPLAVLRAVSDAPGAELFAPVGLLGVAKALRSLRSARPALSLWGAATGPRDVLLASPRSYCAGVRRAVEAVERALARFGPPVYVRRQIVHNALVVARLEEAGAVFVQELVEVPDGATVVFSAHGVGDGVRTEATERAMVVIDATCPLVSKVHNEARRFASAGRQVVLVGHAGHDEVEGTLGSVPGAVLVSTPEDVATLDLREDLPTAVVTQTTLATDEVTEVMDVLHARFPDLARPAASDICYASQNRQEAVRAMAPDCDLVLVVGSSNSSNSNRLVEVARRCGTVAHLVGGAADVRLSWLAGARRVGLTAGASAPEELVTGILECLAGLGPVSLSERSTGTEHVFFPLPPEVR